MPGHLARSDPIGPPRSRRVNNIFRRSSGGPSPPVKRLPPRPLLVPLALTSILVWAVPRAILTAGARVMAALYDISPSLSPITLILLAAAVSWVVLLDITISRERVFAQNLGLGPRTLLGVAFGTVVLCEVLVEVIPALFSGLTGG